MKRKLLLFLLFVVSISGFAQNPYFYLQSISSYPTLEGTAIGYKLTISGAIATNVYANVSTSIDSCTASDADFTAMNTTVTIPSGQTNSNVFYVYTTNDNLPESNEYFKLSVSITSNNTSNLSTETFVYITDDDNIPTLYSNDLSKYEGQGWIYVTYNLTYPYHSNIEIHSLTTFGTALASDFTAVNSTFTIPAGQTQFTIAITVTDDMIIEPDETFVLETNVTSGNTTNTNLSNTMTIKDNDTTPSISLGSNQCIEGQTVTLTGYLNRPYNSNVVVNFTTVAGSASSSDFTPISIVQTIFAGNTAVSISVPTNNDSIDEPIETFTINGAVTSGNTTNNTFSSVVSIVDNDGLPDLSIIGNDGEIFEGSDYRFYIALSTPSTSNTVLNVATSAATADNSDFTMLNSTVSIPAGQYGTQISIPTALDGLQEGTENFTITATNLSGTTFNTTANILADIYDNYNIHTQSDNIIIAYGVGGNYSLIANDYLHGATVSANEATFTMSSNSIGATINAQGEIVIPASTPMGGYEGLYYTACEVANPSNCSTTYCYVSIVSPLTATLTASYVDLNGDGFTNAGDVIHVVYTLSNIGNAPITNIYFDSANGLSNFTGGPIDSLAPGQSNSTTFSGNYIINQNDITAGIIYPYYSSIFKGTYDSTLVTVTVFVGAQSPVGPLPIVLNVNDGLKLNAFIDLNSNTIQDGLEVNFPYGNYDYSINGGVVHNIYSNTFHHLYESNPNSLYNLTYNIDAPYYAYNTCSTSYSNVSVPLSSGITTKNFPVNATPYQDLSVYLIPFSTPRPGVVYKNDIFLKNYSNQLVNSGTLTFIKDNAVEITNVSQTGTVATSTGFNFNFINLVPYETRHISVEMLVPAIPTVNLGDLLGNSVSVNTPVGDILPFNNNSNLSQIVIGSYDPNSIEEAHGEEILHFSFSSNDYLTYTIRFENTGTANASFVKITNILNDKLEPSSLRMIASSENYVLDRIDNALVWKFNEINLPPSNGSSTTGHGFVTYQIKPKTGYAVADVISNVANIYFDTNPAIVTNVCNTTFVNLLSTENSKFENFKYFPNPVKNSFSISNNYIIDNVSISTILGQTILNKKINEFQTNFELSNLSKGIYLVKILSGESEKIIKIVKD